MIFTKIKDYIICGFKYKNTYYILGSFTLIFLALFLLSLFAGKNTFVNAFSVSAAVVFLADLFCLLFKWGFLSTTIEKYKKNKEDSKKNKEKIRLEKMSPREREIHKKVLERREQKEKELKTLKKVYDKSNLGWYLVLLISLVMFVSVLPFIIF